MYEWKRFFTWLRSGVCFTVTWFLFLILLLPDADGVLHYAGQSGHITAGQAAYWSVDPGTNQAAPVAQFMDSHENILATVTLSYQTEEGVWYAFTEN